MGIYFCQSNFYIVFLDSVFVLPNFVSSITLVDTKMFRLGVSVVRKIKYVPLGRVTEFLLVPRALRPLFN